MCVLCVHTNNPWDTLRMVHNIVCHIQITIKSVAFFFSLYFLTGITFRKEKNVVFENKIKKMYG